MLTGKRAFTGDNAATVIGAVMKDDPLAISALPSTVPPAVTRILNRCLAKDRERRYQSARDVALDLEEAAFVAAPKAVDRRTWIGGAAAASLVSGIGIGRFWPGKQAANESRMMDLAIPTPEGHRITSNNAPISPDGRTITFQTVDAEGRRFQWFHPLDGSTPRQFPSDPTSGGWQWSPDGKRLLHSVENGIQVVNAISMAVESSHALRTATWCGTQDLVAVGGGGYLTRVSLSGGSPVSLRIATNTPRSLGTSTNFLYAREFSPTAREWFGGSRDGKELGKVLESANEVRYGGGYLFFSNAENRLSARAFDPDQVRFLDETIHQVPIPTGSAFRVSAQRDITYRSGVNRSVNRHFDRESGITKETVSGSHPEFSVDGKRLLTLRDDITIWVQDLERGSSNRLEAGRDSGVAVWSPDESKIYFSGRGGLYVMPAIGSATPTKLTSVRTHHIHASPDGSFVAATIPKEGKNLLVVFSTGDGAQRIILESAARLDHAQFSPDSKWLAFACDETGNFEAYITPFPSGGPKWSVSVGGGGMCRWRRDGREIYYSNPNGEIFSVAVDISGPEPRLGKPVRIFENNAAIPATPRFAASPDGKQFVVSTQIRSNRPANFHVLTNWRPSSGV